MGNYTVAAVVVSNSPSRADSWSLVRCDSTTQS